MRQSTTKWNGSRSDGVLATWMAAVVAVASLSTFNVMRRSSGFDFITWAVRMTWGASWCTGVTGALALIAAVASPQGERNEHARPH